MTSKLAHFELLEEIGSGGMGKVYRAFDPSLNRTVAIKILSKELADDPKFVEDFLREAQNAASISHPHIVQIYFVGSEDDQYFLAMELLNGNPLSRLLEEAGPLPEGRVLKIGIEAVEALRAAYDRQMIHGDIKPQNLFITDSAGVKLCDFGLAKLANVEAPQTDEVWGSAYYIAPERIQRKSEDFRSDVYSLGATMFEALTGQPPYDAKTAEEVVAMHLNEPVPSLRAIKPSISEHTEKIITKMLDKSPLLRYQDYSYLLRDLRDAEAAISEDATVGSQLRRTAPVPAPPASRTPMIVLGASLVAVALAAAAIAFVVLQKKTPPPAVASAAPSASPAAVAAAAPAAQPSIAPGTATRRVTFHYENPTAKTVMLSGTFNNWTPELMASDPHGGWTVRKDLPLYKSVEYQFVVDGKGVGDPSKKNPPVPDGRGGEKTVYVIKPVRGGKQQAAHEGKAGKNKGVAEAQPADATEEETSQDTTAEIAEAPAPSATSAPVVIDLAAIAKSPPAQWPKSVLLKQPTVFPAVLNGNIVGEIQVPVGTPVNVVSVQADGVTVEYRNGKKLLPANATDVIERFGKANPH